MHNSQGYRDSKQKGSMTPFSFGEVLPWEASSPAPFQLLPNTKLTRCSEVGNPRLGPHCRRGNLGIALTGALCDTAACPGLGLEVEPRQPGGEGTPQGGGRRWGGCWAQDSWFCRSALISRPLHKRWLPLNTTHIFKEQTSHLYLNDE